MPVGHRQRDENDRQFKLQWFTDVDSVGKFLITGILGGVLEQVLHALQGCLDQIVVVKEHVQNDCIDNGLISDL